MRVEVRPAVRADILSVCLDLSRQSLRDIRSMEMGPVETLGFFGSRVPEKDAVTFTINDMPEAVFGWDKTLGEWYSWMLAAEDWFQRDPRPTLAAREHLRRVQAKNPSVKLCTMLHFDDAQVSRWMKCLGYEERLPLWRMWVYSGHSTNPR